MHWTIKCKHKVRTETQWNKNVVENNTQLTYMQLTSKSGKFVQWIKYLEYYTQIKKITVKYI